MFRLSFPYIYIYTHVSDIKNKKRMCSFSFNGLDEMNKTKCLQEITTIYYKWNILLVSSVLVEIMFRWINIMSSYFFFSACIHLLFDVRHLALSSNHIFIFFQQVRSSSSHHYWNNILSLHFTLSQKRILIMSVYTKWRQKVCKESKRNI
jgi:hypothetical protein